MDAFNSARVAVVCAALFLAVLVLGLQGELLSLASTGHPGSAAETLTYRVSKGVRGCFKYYDAEGIVPGASRSDLVRLNT